MHKFDILDLMARGARVQLTETQPAAKNCYNEEDVRLLTKELTGSAPALTEQ